MTVFVRDTFTDNDAVLLDNHTPVIARTWTKRLGVITVILNSTYTPEN